MSRRSALSGVLLAISFVALAGADEPPPKGEKVDPPKTGKTGKFDRDGLKQLREKLGGANPDTSKLQRLTWKIGDDTREALVYSPPRTGKKRPVVFAFHGHGGRSEYAARKFAFHELWPEAVCVYPQGLPTAVPVIDKDGKFPGWQKGLGDQKDRDLAFFDAMLKTMKADHEADEARVYVAGHSNGGYFTYTLLAARGDAITAVAPVAAAFNPKDFKDQKAKPVIHVAGEKDPIVRFALQERAIEQVKKLNGCDAAGKPAGKFCTEFASKGGSPVVTFIHPGGHEVPDEAPNRIVEFFQAQPKK
jgi:polyhydroxybutyrate depolymerase